MASKILTGDQVYVVRGRDRGQVGVVRRHLTKEDKVIVEGVNVVRKHIRREQGGRQGGIVEVEAPIWKSKVMVVCPSCEEPTRVGFRFTDEGEKVRYCHKCDSVIPRPEV